MSKRILLLAGSLMLCFTLSACGQATVETTPPPPTPTPEAVTTPAPTPKAPDFEEPPVIVTYQVANDLNSDGTIGRDEWDTWVTAHPEDTNQDMFLTDVEKGITTSQTPEVTPEITPPAIEVTPPAPVVTPKPVVTPQLPVVTPPIESLDVEDTNNTYSEAQRKSDEEAAKKFGGEAVPGVNGGIGVDPDDWNI